MRLNLPVVIFISVIAVLAVYGSFYAYATTNIQPQDLKTFKEDLKNIESTKISESEINTLSDLANKIKTGTEIKKLPQEQVSTYSAAMKPNDSVNKSIGDLNNKTKSNQAIATRYDLLFKGDIAKEIRKAYNVKLVDLRLKMIQTREKAAKDFSAGDNAAVAEDLNQYVEYAKQYNSLIDTAISSLDYIIGEMDHSTRKTNKLVTPLDLKNSS